MGTRFRLLRDTSNDDGDRRHLLGLSRQWGEKLWYAKGDQDSVNELLNLWVVAEAMSGYPKPDPDAPVQFTWLNDVLSYAVQPIHRALLDGKSLQGGRYFDEEHTVLLVSDYCIAAIDLCRDNANAALKREHADGAPPALPALPATVESVDSNGADRGGASWTAIEISFLSDERVQIHYGATTETRNYAELGFEDGRTKNPNQAWAILRVLAAQNGVIRNGVTAGVPWPKVEKRIQEIRKVLRKHFGVADDPIPFVDGVGYQACFKIGCAPSFHT